MKTKQPAIKYANKAEKFVNLAFEQIKADHPYYSDADALNAIYDIIDDKFINAPKIPPEYSKAFFDLQNKVHTRLI